jgi:hypothetical protein
MSCVDILIPFAFGLYFVANPKLRKMGFCLFGVAATYLLIKLFCVK